MTNTVIKTFSKPMGPFGTTVIADHNGKTVGHIRKVATGGVVLTSLISSPWFATLPGINAKTNVKWFGTRTEAKTAAKKIGLLRRTA